MTQVLLFHHAQGLTEGVDAFADELRAAGHDVTTPDLSDGATFGTHRGGLEHVRRIGFEEIVERGWRAADELPADVVYAGLSLGVMPAQMLAQTRPGARGALLLHGCVPTSAFGSPWPTEVPVQIHAMDADPSFVDEGDIEAARELTQQAQRAELFLYPGNRHLFTDRSLPDYDEDAATLLIDRVLAFLDGGVRSS
jgi:dienelactone hydrolase